MGMSCLVPIMEFNTSEGAARLKWLAYRWGVLSEHGPTGTCCCLDCQHWGVASSICVSTVRTACFTARVWIVEGILEIACSAVDRTPPRIQPITCESKLVAIVTEN